MKNEYMDRARKVLHEAVKDSRYLKIYCNGEPEPVVVLSTTRAKELVLIIKKLIGLASRIKDTE